MADQDEATVTDQPRDHLPEENSRVESSDIIDVDQEGSQCECSCDKNTDGKLSRSYRHRVTCTAKGPFPFEKLPPEIRAMIVRFSLPDDRAQPLHFREENWNKEHDCSFNDYFGILQQREARAEVIPVSLFRVNKALSAEAIRVFHNETYFRIDVDPFEIHTRGAVARRLESFTNHAVLAEWTPFKYMRNYHLNIKPSFSAVVQWFDPVVMNIFEIPCPYEDSTETIREWLRLVADELMSRGIIRNLTITAPCNCALKAAGQVPRNVSTVDDLLAPLKRICVPGSVSISFHHDKWEKQGDQNPCRKPGCLSLAQRVQASIGRLEGEPLSEREAAWKEVKSFKRHDGGMRKYGDYMEACCWGQWMDAKTKDVWVCLNGRGFEVYDEDTESDSFERAVRCFHRTRAEVDARRLKQKRHEERKAERKAERQVGLKSSRGKPGRAGGGVQWHMPNEGTSQQKPANHDDHEQGSEVRGQLEK
ncbi:MAG: hypothetical protein LQ344_005907 [Seirophora lacunosa]|nr:MAG: hypothetical protein LQ344_005907 [Seirophora lacunosa]